VLVQPVQELKLFPPDVDCAVKVTDVLLLYVRINWVDPLPCPLLSFGLTVIDTPLAGLVEDTVKVRVGVVYVPVTFVV
jgi:hypothetical protein